MPFSVRIAEELGLLLMGRTGGRRDFARLCGLLSEVPSGEPVLLDFDKVQVVTASWVNAALVPLMQWASSEQTNIFPLILNVSADSIDELRLVAENSHLCFLIASNESPPKSAKLVGSLDAGQLDTLKTVLKMPEVTGAELHSKRKDIQATAWNNRLKDLHGKRLLRRQKRGREQVYSPVVKEITVHG